MWVSLGLGLSKLSPRLRTHMMPLKIEMTLGSTASKVELQDLIVSEGMSFGLPP